MAAIERQISLPLSKAVEIAYKSIRLRLSRSLLVTSGIVLALAFLVSIQASEAISGGMRRWVAQSADAPKFVALRQERSELEQKIRPLEARIRAAVRAAPKPAEGASPPAEFDAKREFGEDFDAMRRDAGDLPGAAADLETTAMAQPTVLADLHRWFDAARQLKHVKEQLTAPQQLQAMMKQNGLPTGEAEIRSSRVQTNWLLGLALLVAFVGILNAMLMSVTERFREIGTMKCLGALDGFIIKLFLIESLFQGVVGTVLGVAIGLGLSFAGAAASYGGFAWINLPVAELLQGVMVCTLIGIGLTVAGALYPAWQAARMQPIAAMRVET